LHFMQFYANLYAKELSKKQMIQDSDPSGNPSGDPSGELPDQRPRYEILEEEIKRLHDESRAADAFLVAYGADPAHTEMLESSVAAYSEAKAEAEQAEQKPPHPLDFLSSYGGVPGEVVEALRILEDTPGAVESLEDELEAQTPEKAEALARRAADLEARIDYNAMARIIVVEDSDAVPPELADTSAGVSQVIGLLQLLEAGETDNYIGISQLYDKIGRLEEKWTQHNLLTEHERPSETSTESENPLGKTVKLLELIKDITDPLHERYRDNHQLKQRNLSRILRDTKYLQELCAEEEPPKWHLISDARQWVTNEPLRAALATATRDRLSPNQYDLFMDSEAYQELAEQVRNIDVDAALDSLDLQIDFGEVPFEFSETELKDFLRSEIPPLALERVKRLEFREMTDEEDEKDVRAGFQYYDNELGGSVIVMSTQVMRENAEFEAEDGDQEAQRKWAKGEMLGTLTHEYGHTIHTTMPVALLRLWERAREREQVDVTPNVQQRYDEGHDHRFGEDFADSLKLFRRDSPTLHVLAPYRFEAMSTIFGEIMPGYDPDAEYAFVDRLQQKWAERGETAEVIRAEHQDYLVPKIRKRPSPEVQAANRR
jgi:hypothetical protein